jgi:hypothetical protein
VDEGIVRPAPPAQCPRGAWRVSVRLLFRVEKLVNVGLEHIEGKCPGQEFDSFDFRTVGLGIPEEEGWCACHTHFLAFLKTVIDLRGVFAAVKTSLESLDVQPQCLGMPRQRLGLQLLLMGEQAVVHRLAFPLFIGTPERLGGFAGKLMNRLQGKVAGDIAELPRRNVCLLELWQRLTDVSGTEGSLVIGEFDERERGLFVAFGEGVRNAQGGIDVTNRRAILAARGQEFFHLL